MHRLLLLLESFLPNQARESTAVQKHPDSQLVLPVPDVLTHLQKSHDTLVHHYHSVLQKKTLAFLHILFALVS